MKMVYIQVIEASKIQFRLCFQTWCIFWRKKENFIILRVNFISRFGLESWSCQFYCCLFAACSVLDWCRTEDWNQRDWNGMDWSRCYRCQLTHWNWTKWIKHIARVAYTSVDNSNEAPANHQKAIQFWCMNKTWCTPAHPSERNNAPINAWKWWVRILNQS